MIHAKQIHDSPIKHIQWTLTMSSWHPMLQLKYIHRWYTNDTHINHPSNTCVSYISTCTHALWVFPRCPQPLSPCNPLRTVSYHVSEWILYLTSPKCIYGPIKTLTHGEAGCKSSISTKPVSILYDSLFLLAPRVRSGMVIYPARQIYVYLH